MSRSKGPLACARGHEKTLAPMVRHCAGIALGRRDMASAGSSVTGDEPIFRVQLRGELL
jgi:hypothetical protein